MQPKRATTRFKYTPKLVVAAEVADQKQQVNFFTPAFLNHHSIRFAEMKRVVVNKAQGGVFVELKDASRKTVKKKPKPESLSNFFKRLPDEEACLKFFEKASLLSKRGCPKCKHDKFTTHTLKKTGKKRHKCCKCRTNFSSTQGTVFARNKIPYEKWMLAFHMVSSRRKGVSSLELAKEIEVAKKTAHYMLEKIRVMQENRMKSITQLSGVIEIDEVHFFKGAKELIILGLMQRNGPVYMVPIPDMTQPVIQGVIRKMVKPGSIIITDEHSSYIGLDDDYTHCTVNHKDRQWAKPGGITTNRIESIWSMVRKRVQGTYHTPSRKHLDLYAAEFAFWHADDVKNLEDPIAELLKWCAGNVTYKSISRRPVTWNDGKYERWLVAKKARYIFYMAQKERESLKEKKKIMASSSRS